MEPHEARTGMPVRVKEGYRKRDLVGMRGTVRKCWGSPDYLAVDVDLEDGRSELLWFHQLEVVESDDATDGAGRLSAPVAGRKAGWRKGRSFRSITT